MIKIIAGLGYESRLPNHLPELLNTKICSELSLIDELEFRVGIPKQKEDRASRIIAYLNALKKANKPTCFYHASLDTDALSTAETLLQWRDWALAYGWNPSDQGNNHGRLVDLAEVEHHFFFESLSLPERIFRLIPLVGILKGTFEGVILHTEHSHWPPVYQHLFNQLQSSGIDIIEDVPKMLSPLANEGCDLWKLQKAILNKKVEPFELSNDGSLRLYNCSSNQVVADFIAHYNPDSSLIITQSQDYGIETAVNKLNQISLGLGSTSVSRIPNHLLQLSLQCAWLTPSPEIVLQYLTLPTGKFKTLRRQLARQFKDLPGYNPDEWQCSIDEYVASEIKKQPVLNESVLRQSIHEWLPISCCQNDENMPVKQAIEIAKRISGYWKTLCSVGDDVTKDIYLASYRAADAMVEALSNWPDSEINKVQLNRLLTIIRKLRPSTFCQPREVSRFDVVKNPESINLTSQNIEHLIWLDPNLQEKVGAPPFSKDELLSIPWAPTHEQQALIKERALQRACSVFLKARKSVCLINLNQHTDLFKLFINQLICNRRWSELESSLLLNTTREVSLSRIKDLSLPHPQRWCTLGVPIQSNRPKESYSSLSSLVNKPHEYVFKYCAKISEGTIEAIAVDHRLKGNLAHRIIERWFTSNPWMGKEVSQDYISEWLNVQLPVFIRQFALPLAQSGKHVERLEFHEVMFNAISGLCNLFHQANVKGVVTERHMEVPFSSGNLEGNMDIICEFGDEKFAIIDMKWGGYDQYKQELKSNTALQLATYAYIAQKDQKKELIDAGYFILSKAELLCNSNTIFPTATVIYPEQPGSLNNTWAQFERTIQWRRAQLKEGLIEITYGVAASDEYSIPPDGCLSLVDSEEKYLKGQTSSYKKNYKKIDVWRNLTGNIKE
ncbi:PD-(D/E)XK nuclease family protein [Legionella pneumophila]|uniref:PD-(D/E)XK nuclease family protein n=1 Tax=Legionella pneumophila TaxID=446 RepID=UPI000776C446|nr:PD-(D/E)XK nuclease family protein [Legionella pneumophila]MDW8872822.1 PD-(D/E)XK nuclease family protein [Legionella pneumophila]HAT8656779.1 hypothetical protein [Legionella pneumophila]